MHIKNPALHNEQKESVMATIGVVEMAPDVVAEAVEKQSECDQLNKQIHRLSGKEMWVLEMRFGMPDGSSLSGVKGMTAKKDMTVQVLHNAQGI